MGERHVNAVQKQGKQGRKRTLLLLCRGKQGQKHRANLFKARDACGDPVAGLVAHPRKPRARPAVAVAEADVEKLVAAIKRADLGFSNHDRPRGIFLFTGESGVGKTALAIELERNLFYSEKSLLRFDMSEYSEKQSVSKLIGSPPGYVGHGNGGALTEAVKKRPHSVILFDEIEKADKEILNLLLQIADYGYLSDALGRKINFRNTIIIATSNISSSSTRGKVGFSSTREAETKDTDIFKRYYTKELINRFDEIIHFSPLSEDALKTIVKDELEKLAASLQNVFNGALYIDNARIVLAAFDNYLLGLVRDLNSNSQAVLTSYL